MKRKVDDFGDQIPKTSIGLKIPTVSLLLIEMALRVTASILLDEKQPASLRPAAATYSLDRAYGRRPLQSMPRRKIRG